jgi:integrase/recombinase XerD
MPSPLEAAVEVAAQAVAPSAPPAVPKTQGPAAPSEELRELGARYFVWMEITRYAPTTIDGARSDLSWLFRFLGMRAVGRVADVTPDLLNDYSLWLRENKTPKQPSKTPNLANLHHRLNGVKRFFKWLAQNMIVLYDPAEDLELPRLHYSLPRTILTQEEVRKFLDAPDLKSPVGYRDKAVLELIYATGIRSAEVYKLKAADVDLKARTVFVRLGKGGKDRLLPLPGLTVGYLREYIEKVRPRFMKNARLDDHGALFIGYNGAAFGRYNLAALFRRTTKTAQLDKWVCAMVLRHSIASHLLENGMDIRYIQEFLGHERMSTTQIYAKVTLTGLQKKYKKTHPKEKRARGRKQILDGVQPTC